MLIYVAGPYTADTPGGIAFNVDRAISVACDLIERGHNPYVPHFTYYLDQMLQQRKVTVEYERWMELDREWMEKCDALFFIGPSPGTNRELVRMAELKKIVYASMEQVPDLDGTVSRERRRDYVERTGGITIPADPLTVAEGRLFQAIVSGDKP